MTDQPPKTSLDIQAELTELENRRVALLSEVGDNERRIAEVFQDEPALVELETEHGKLVSRIKSVDLAITRMEQERTEAATREAIGAYTVKRMEIAEMWAAHEALRADLRRANELVRVLTEQTNTLHMSGVQKRNSLLKQAAHLREAGVQPETLDALERKYPSGF